MKHTILLFTAAILVLSCQQPAPTALYVSAGKRLALGEYLSVSPDGSELAYSRGGQIFVSDVNGNNEIQVSHSQYGDYDPAWSYDGRRLAFTRTLRDIVEFYRETETYSNVMIFDFFTRGAFRVYPFDTTADYWHQRQTNALWSPSDDKIAFADDSSSFHFIRIATADGTGQLLDQFEVDTFCWSPNGKQFVCTLNAGGIWLGTLGMQDLAQLSQNGAASSLTWLSNTNTIAYFTGHDTLIFLDVSTRQETIIRHSFYFYPTISPDGSHVASAEYYRSPSASPDDAGSFFLHCFDVSKSADTVLAQTNSSIELRWHPLSVGIFFVCDGQIYYLDVPK